MSGWKRNPEAGEPRVTLCFFGCKKPATCFVSGSPPPESDGLTVHTSFSACDEHAKSWDYRKEIEHRASAR